MMKTVEEKEAERFIIAASALREVGVDAGERMLGDILPDERRSYFFARPSARDDEPRAAFTIERLGRALDAEKVPVLVDWRRDAETFGLRYTSSFVPIAAELQAFRSDEAKAEWRSWRAGVKDEQAVLADVAGLSLRSEMDQTPSMEASGPVGSFGSLRDRIRQKALSLKSRAETNVNQPSGSAAEQAEGRDAEARREQEASERRARGDQGAMTEATPLPEKKLDAPRASRGFSRD